MLKSCIAFEKQLASQSEFRMFSVCRCPHETAANTQTHFRHCLVILWCYACATYHQPSGCGYSTTFDFLWLLASVIGIRTIVGMAIFRIHRNWMARIYVVIWYKCILFERTHAFGLSKGRPPPFFSASLSLSTRLDSSQSYIKKLLVSEWNQLKYQHYRLVNT